MLELPISARWIIQDHSADRQILFRILIFNIMLKIYNAKNVSLKNILNLIADQY